MTLLRLLQALGVFVSLCLSATAAHAQEKARAAEDFVDSIGVVDSDPTISPFAGIRHSRFEALVGDTRSPSINWNLWNGYGIGDDIGCNPYYNDPISVDLNNAYAYPIGSIDQLEGLNEPDNGVLGSMEHYAGQTGIPAAFDWQNAFYPVFKSDATLRGIPILSFPYAGPGNTENNPTFTSYDFIALHDYYGSGIPARDTDRNITDVDGTGGQGGIAKPIMITEFGYSTNTGNDWPVTELAQGKNIPRTFCEYFLRGVRRSYVFSLYDTDQTYGLMRYDSSQPSGYYYKPAFRAMQNLIATLTDSTVSGANPPVRTVNAFTPGWLDYTLSGGQPGSLGTGSSLNNIHHILLQKSNGDFYLLIWNHVQVTANVNQSNNLAPDVTNAPVPVVFNLKTPISGATIYTQNGDGTYQTQANAPIVDNSLAVSVTDGMVVVHLTPANGLGGTQAGPAATTQVLALQCGGGSNGSFKDDGGYYFTYTNPAQTDAGGTAEPAVNGGGYNWSANINAGNVSNPAPAGVYSSERWGISTYNLPGLLTGQRFPYTVRLHFCENPGFTAPGKRLFDAYLNGYKVLNDFDIFKTAGGNNIATIQQFTAFANSDGKIIPQFLPHSVENPKIDGIELLSGNDQVFQDNLTDFSKVDPSSGNLANWTIDTFNDNTGRHGLYGTRATRVSDTTQYLVYRLPNMQTFTAQVQWYQNANLGGIEFFASPDGDNWTPLLVTSSVGVGAYNWAWNFANFTSPCGLPSDTNYLKVRFDQGADTNYDNYAHAGGPELAFMNITYAPSGPAEAPYNGPHSLPGTVQIEDYDIGGQGLAYNASPLQYGNQTGYRSDNNGDVHPNAGPGGNNYAVGWSYPGDWYRYTVNVQTTGSYTATFQYASNGPGGTFHLEDEAGNNLTGTLIAQNTNGWGNWQTLTSPAFSLSVGTHTLRLVEDTYNSPNTPWIADFDWFAVNAAQLSGAGVMGQGQAYIMPTTFNLSNLGPTDWAHWGLNGLSMDHESNGSGGAIGAISNFTPIGGGGNVSFGDSKLGFTWSNGTPTQSVTATTTGVVAFGVGSGFSFTVPATPAQKTVTVYVGGWDSDGQLSAYVDGGAVSYSDSSFGYNKPGNYDGSHYFLSYTLTYAASDTNNRLLHLSWTQIAGSGNVTLMAVADPPAPGGTVTLPPTADSYTRDGSYAGTNYGTATPLYAKVSTSGYNRNVFFQFNLASVKTAVSSAKFQVYDYLSLADSLTINCDGNAGSIWTESGITWNNQPALGSFLSSAVVSNTTPGWTTWDATAFVNANLGKTVTLALASAGTTSAGAAWSGNSRESTSNPPQLVIKH